MSAITSNASPSSPQAKFWNLRPQTIWTLVGASAIPLWATWPLLATLARAIPFFEFLTIIFAVAAAFLSLRKKPVAQNPVALNGWLSSLLPSVMVALGILFSNLLFLWATRTIPPAQANLIVYLWPVMVTYLGASLGLVLLKPYHWVSILLGLGGAALVVGTESLSSAWQGIGLALISGLIWAVYVVYRMWQGANAPDALTRGFWLSAAVCLGFHLASETTVVPAFAAVLCAVLVGVVPLALGNLVWDLGIRRGDQATLTVLAYATPLVAAVFLVLAGLAAPTMGLLLGGILIVVAGVISAR